MTGRASRDAGDEAAALAGRLRARRAEIEQAVVLRVSGVADPPEQSDPVYLEGLLEALRDALDYALAAIELGEERAPQLPPGLFAQARRAARNGVSIETVLRRYLAGYNVVGEFLIAEAEAADMKRAALGNVLRGQGALFDRLLAAVSDEYRREVAMRIVSPQQRRAARIKRLLSGEMIDPADLNYDLDAFHVGVIGWGEGIGPAVRALAKGIDKRLLLLAADETVSAWLGSQRPIEADEFEGLLRQAEETLPATACFAFGEPAEGLAGWRLTHRQGAAALPFAQREKKRVVRYADVALISSIARDSTLATSLEQLYLAPLTAAPDGGESLRETLRVYFACRRNVTSAARALGLSRPTVRARLRAAEERIGRSVDESAGELELALCLHEIAGTIATVPPIVPRW